MYWKTGDYPELAGLSKRDRKRIVTEAIKASGAAISVRFVIAVLSYIAVPALIGNIEALPDWTGLVVLAIGGICFYCYLLVELNGPLHRAVQEFISNANTV